MQFDTEMNTCSRNCWAMKGCVTNCFKDAEDYSPACADCFGSLAWCTIQNCWLSCIGGEAENCNTCSSEHCLPGFLTCSGLQMEDVHGGIPAPASAPAPAPVPTLTGSLPKTDAPAPAPTTTSVPSTPILPLAGVPPASAASSGGVPPAGATFSAQVDVPNSEQLRRRLAVGGLVTEAFVTPPVTLLV